MSGGSSSKPKTETKAAEPSTIPGTGPMMTQPAFMGDNQNLLAQQLAAGGYGSMPDIMAMLTQTFTPMQVLNTQPGATPAPGIPSTPSTPSQPGGSGAGSGLGGMAKTRARQKWAADMEARGSQ